MTNIGAHVSKLNVFLVLLCICVISEMLRYYYVLSSVSFKYSPPHKYAYNLRNIFLGWDINTRACNNSAPFKSRPISVNLSVPDQAVLTALSRQLQPGGRFTTSRCSNPDRVAIIVPYRERQTHLKVLLMNLHPFLQRQDIQYGIYVVELVANVTFNRALLMNVGYVEASKLEDYQCYVFHDVDLIPENDANWYTCPKQPRHMSASIDKHNYSLPYNAIFGGVSALTSEQFEQVNGFSNVYFGWGGEDDDMYSRVKNNDMNVTRYSVAIARYKAILHRGDVGNEENPERYHLLQSSSQRQSTDGLNSVKYQLIDVQNVQNLYTRILVSFTEADYGLNFTNAEYGLNG